MVLSTQVLAITKKLEHFRHFIPADNSVVQQQLMSLVRLEVDEMLEQRILTNVELQTIIKLFKELSSS